MYTYDLPTAIIDIILDTVDIRYVYWIGHVKLGLNIGCT